MAKKQFPATSLAPLAKDPDAEFAENPADSPADAAYKAMVRRLSEQLWARLAEGDDEPAAYPGITAARAIYAKASIDSDKLIAAAIELCGNDECVAIVVAKGWWNYSPWCRITARIRHYTCCEASPAEACVGAVADAMLIDVLGRESFDWVLAND